MSLRSLSQLLFPPRCASCQLPGLVLCSHCSQAWTGAVRTGRIDALPLMWLSTYSPLTSPIILAAKEDNDRACQKILAQSLDRGVAEALRLGWISPNRTTYLLPIPSSQKNSRIRGRVHLRTVINQMRTPMKLLDLLIIDREVRDQSALGRVARAQNLAGAYRIRGDFAPSHYTRGADMAQEQSRDLRDGNLIIVDDLITTGSSLREAVRALKVAQISPDFALTACAARPG